MRNVDGTFDIEFSIRMREQYGIMTVWSDSDVHSQGLEILDVSEGCLLDSYLCEDKEGRLIIFAERALTEWTSALIPIIKETNEETWNYWYNNFVHDDIEYEVVIKRPNGEEEVIHKNLTKEQAIEYTDYIDNTYYKEQDMQ